MVTKHAVQKNLFFTFFVVVVIIYFISKIKNKVIYFFLVRLLHKFYSHLCFLYDQFSDTTLI
jgi:hypothetical protein